MQKIKQRVRTEYQDVNKQNEEVEQNWKRLFRDFGKTKNKKTVGMATIIPWLTSKNKENKRSAEINRLEAAPTLTIKLGVPNFR